MIIYYDRYLVLMSLTMCDSMGKPTDGVMKVAVPLGPEVKKFWQWLMMS